MKGSTTAEQDDPAAHTNHESESQNSQSPFRVLGIALVVDQKGKTPRMVLRYPTTPLLSDTEDIFFRLPSRQMAKLFRPKPSLCRQPMTLSVGGTVFCCLAVLMEDDSQEASSDDGTAAENKDHLVLFSVIVALAPQIPTSSIPVSAWFEGKAEEKLQMDQSLQQSLSQQTLSLIEGKLGVPSSKGSRASASFLCVRRVHVSMARLCRVLEREERRCRFVSLHATLFSQIRNEHKKKWHEQKKATTSSKPNSSAASPVSTTSKVTLGSERRPAHRRAGSFVSMNAASFDNRERENTKERAGAKNSVSVDDQLEQEHEQELLEIFMAAPPPTNPDTGIEHQGNLARELVQFYHALARNDHRFTPTPSVLLTGRDGIIYINRHIAVAVEAVSPLNNRTTDGKLRPYHTLLFPYASPSGLLESLSSTGSVAPRRLQQLLLMANPQKSLTDIAVDANLPLQTTLEIAAYLVGQSACMASFVLSRSCRLACQSIDSIKEVSLAFAQEFGVSVDLFVLVSFLTDPGKTLGEVLACLTSSEDAEAVWLRERMVSSLPLRPNDRPSERSPVIQSEQFSKSPMRVERERVRYADDLEELLFRMVIWLCSHRVLVHLQEYLVLVSASGSATHQDDATNLDKGEKKVESSMRSENASDDFLFRELQDSDCLKGKTSIQACCWHMGIEPVKLRAFAMRHSQVRIILRAPTSGDDWGAL